MTHIKDKFHSLSFSDNISPINIADGTSSLFVEKEFMLLPFCR